MASSDKFSSNECSHASLTDLYLRSVSKAALCELFGALQFVVIKRLLHIDVSYVSIAQDLQKSQSGPTMIAARIIGDARTTIIDPERSSADAVHEFRRSMKQWRALMRLLEPVVCPQFLGL